MSRKHLSTAVGAISIALVVSLASIASARPFGGTEAVPPTTHSTTHSVAVVRPNPDEQAGIGGAVGQRSVSQPSPEARYSVPALLYSGPGIRAQRPVSSSPRVVHVVASHGGFAWGDAAIGAGATLILLAIALAGVGAATQGRRRTALKRGAVAAG